MADAAAGAAGGGAEQTPDPGGAVAAINRYRELARWLITVFAAIGGLLVAGSQLSSLGKLDLEDDLGRLIAAAFGLALALAMAAWLVTRALAILRPVEMSLDVLIVDTPVAAKLNAMPSALPFGATNVADVRTRLQDAIDNPFLTAEQKKAWRDQLKPLLDYASYLKIQGNFDGVWSDMAKAAALAALGILIFAYAANPPKAADDAAPATPATPTAGTISLTAAGKDALKDDIGKDCPADPLKAIAIGGTASAPDVITTPAPSCKVARFVLAADWGHWRRDATAPSP